MNSSRKSLIRFRNLHKAKLAQFQKMHSTANIFYHQKEIALIDAKLKTLKDS